MRMAKRHQIRALVVPSRSGFFYDKGHPQGIFYEAMEEFQRYANLKLKTGSVKMTVTLHSGQAGADGNALSGRGRRCRGVRSDCHSRAREA